jgi:membrane fusion protein (multidrug efflux system)
VVEDLVMVRVVGETMKGLGWFLVAALLLLALGCSSSPAPTVSASSGPAVDQPPASKTTAVPQPDVFVAMGPIVVEQQLDVTALRDGVVTELTVDVDSPVKKGQLLARLDDRQLLAEREAGEHKLRSIDADVKNWESEVKMRQVDLQRSEELLKAGIDTQQQVDHDRYNVEATQHEVDRERENLLNARSNLHALDLELETTHIVAPFGGVVARRYIRQGQRVSSGDKLFWVTAVEPLQVRFTLPEQYSRALKLGDELALTSAASQSETASARVIHVSPVVDPASGTVEVIAVLAKPSGFRPGMTASIRVSGKP